MFNLFNIIILLGTIQGFIISILLMISSKLNKSKIYLSLVLFGFSAILLRITLIDIGSQQFLPPLIINFILLIAPAIYLYVVVQANKKISFRLLKISFLPVIITNLGFLIFYITHGKNLNYQDTLVEILKYNEILSLIYYGFYIYITYRFFKTNQPKFTLIQKKWIKRFLFLLIVFIVIWAMYIIAELAIFNYTLSVSDYYPMMIIVSVILYYISFYVYNNRTILFESVSLSKRRNFIISDTESKNLLSKINSLMSDEKIYLNGDLTLNTLAASLKTSPKTLSFVINELCKKNFNDYINEWRVEEVKRRLIDKSYDHLKMLSIAFDCGFNSKSTFNLAFKKATGLSPTEFRNKK